MDKARVPVVPVGIVGNTEDFLDRALYGERPLIEMRIGPPFIFWTAEELRMSRHEARQYQTDSIMAQIAALLPHEYRGVYSSFVVHHEKTG
jgi:hypothetical protein